VAALSSGKGVQGCPLKSFRFAVSYKRKEQEKKAAELTESFKDVSSRIEEIREAYELVHEQHQGYEERQAEPEK